ncbi:MAG: hypothetical protein JSR21_14915 [Proteobacteria bacterium]|nr:hypothetical protein [Pseudomonadota bacterium]
MRRLSVAATLAFSLGIAGSAHAAATSNAMPSPPEVPARASAAVACAADRGMVDAERNYPGALLEMAKQSLADCEHAHVASN